MSNPKEWLYGAEFWVPENHMFKSAPECLEAFPDAGPACGFVSTKAYDELMAEACKLRKALSSPLEDVHVDAQESFDKWLEGK